ncbi:MAG: hypothetical protein ILO36_02320 [Abditibacteriota bacterium]|nr:hypothetical protein [Abditibacteriota bacterium]
MAELVDIHSHLLAGDGPGSMDAALGIIRMEYSMGMRHQFCTPVIESPADFGGIEEIKGKMEQLETSCRAEFPDLRLYLGFEVRPSFDIAGALKKGVPLSMAGTRYVLIGPGDDFCRAGAPEILSLIDAGYIPVLAHPEHTRFFRREPEALEGYVSAGVLLQINIPSIMGVYGNEIKEFADQLLRLRWVSFAAADNKKQHFEARLFTGYQYIVANWRKSKADLLLVENGMKLINNETIDNSAAYPWKPVRKPFFKKLFGV